MKESLKNVVLIGAGQLGSRHLQALAAVSPHLLITVIDPSTESLKVSKERYEQVRGESPHKVKFITSISDLEAKEVDLAIIATSANVRFESFLKLTEKTNVRNAVLEKVLFADPAHYTLSSVSFNGAGTNIWVNCCMRQIKIYQEITKAIKDTGKVFYSVTASKFGLLTNSIHYTDHMSQIIGNNDFQVDPSGLNPDLIPSKREGFTEATGSIGITFPDGSRGVFANFATGNSPIVVEIGSGTERFIVREMEGKAWHCGESTSWQWKEIQAEITPQSVLTTEIAEQILLSGSCPLTTLDESIRIHLNLYEPIRNYFNLEKYSWT